MYNKRYKEIYYLSKTDNPHAMRLYKSLLKHTDEQTAKGIAFKVNISKSADTYKKFVWAESICNDLQNNFDDDTIKEIRMRCACGPGLSKADNLKKLYQSCKDTKEFVSKANGLGQGFTIEAKDNAIILVYPNCYCSCVKRIDKNLPKIWCYCTLGYTKKMFEHVFDRKVDVELLESVKTGGTKCMIKIVWNT